MSISVRLLVALHQQATSQFHLERHLPNTDPQFDQCINNLTEREGTVIQSSIEAVSDDLQNLMEPK